MYTDHFGLEENPFLPQSRTPPPFPSQELKEALAHFLYALKNREGFFLLVGEVGTGKTTAIRAMLSSLPPGTPRAVVSHTSLEARELLEEVLRRFGLEVQGGESKPALVARLEQFLAPSAEGAAAVLILDEAHLLSHAVLEEVRLLSNLKQGDRPLLQICLVGQPELLNRLRQHRLRPLRQRIAVRYVAGALSREETREYIAHRLRTAGAPLPQRIFPPAAADAVYEISSGLPREINVVAGQAMLNAYLEGAPSVTLEHVRSTKRDYGFEGLRYREEDKGKAEPQAAVKAAPAPAPVPAKAPVDLPLRISSPPSAPRGGILASHRPVLASYNPSSRSWGPIVLGMGVLGILALAWALYSRADLGMNSIPPPPVSSRDRPAPLLAPPPPIEEPSTEERISASNEAAAESTPPEVAAASPMTVQEPPRVPPPRPPSPASPRIPSASDRLELGANLARAGRLDEAIAAFREAVLLEPRYTDAHYNLGVSLLENQKPGEAVDALEAAVALSPKDARAQRALGIALRQTGELEKAASALRRAVALDSGDTFALQHLASLLREKGEAEEAVEAIRRAIQLKPEDPSFHQELGFALRAGGRLEEAASAFRTAVELDSTLALAHYTLGVTLHEMGRVGDAERELAEAKRLGYDPR